MDGLAFQAPPPASGFSGTLIISDPHGPLLPPTPFWSLEPLGQSQNYIWGQIRRAGEDTDGSGKESLSDLFNQSH